MIIVNTSTTYGIVDHGEAGSGKGWGGLLSQTIVSKIECMSSLKLRETSLKKERVWLLSTHIKVVDSTSVSNQNRFKFLWHALQVTPSQFLQENPLSPNYIAK